MGLLLLTGWEYGILDWIQTLHTPVLDRIMVFITSLGDGGMLWILSGSALLCFRKYRRAGIMMLLTLAAGHLLGTVFLKEVIGRERPFYSRPDILLLIQEGGYSFPSGHTISSFAAAGALFFRHKKAGIPAIFLAFLIGFSRMYLYVHFPTDVLAGMFLGILIAWAIYEAEQVIRRKQTCQIP